MRNMKQLAPVYVILDREGKPVHILPREIRAANAVLDLDKDNPDGRPHRCVPADVVWEE